MLTVSVKIYIVHQQEDTDIEGAAKDKLKRVQVNSDFVFREEYDDWAILLNPDTSEAYGMNPISTFIYKHLDGERSISDIHNLLISECKNAPTDAETLVTSFIEDLVAKGIAELRETIL